MHSDFIAQYEAVHAHFACWDRSDKGVLIVRGADRLNWLQGMVSNDLRRLQQGLPRVQACLLDATGHLVSDLTVFDVPERTVFARALGLDHAPFLLLDCPPQNAATLTTLLDRYIVTEDVSVTDMTAQIGCFAIQGPQWAMALTELEDDPRLRDVREWTFLTDGDYSGLGGFNAYFPLAERERVAAAGPFAHALWLDEEVRRTARIEAGIPEFGADMDASTLAMEAGLEPSHISLTKGCYVGQEIVARIDSRGHTNRGLVGLLFATGEIPNPGDRLHWRNESGITRETGRITSVAPAAPAVQYRPLAMGYVRHEASTPGTLLQVSGSADLEATIVEFPRLRTHLT